MCSSGFETEQSFLETICISLSLYLCVNLMKTGHISSQHQMTELYCAYNPGFWIKNFFFVTFHDNQADFTASAV